MPAVFDPGEFQFESWMANKAGRFPPLGALFLSSYIKNKFPLIRTSIFDCNVEIPICVRGLKDKDVNGSLVLEDLVKKFLLKEKPDIICISAIFHAVMHNAHQLAMLSKKILPEVIIVAGGAYPTTSPEMALRDKNIDYIVCGEGEIRLEKLLNYFLIGSCNKEDLDGVYINGEQICFSPCKNDYVNLDLLPRISLDLIRYGEYAGISSTRDDAYLFERKNSMAMVVSRGCPNRCSYCNSGESNYYGTKFRTRSIGTVMKDIQYYKEQYNIDEVHFYDENITANPVYTQKLLEGLNNASVVYTVANLELEMLNKSILREYFNNRKKGFFSVGIESGNDRVLKDIAGRRSKKKAIRDKLKIVRKIFGDKGFVNGSFIIGFPDETKDEIYDTIDFAIEVEIDWAAFFCYMPLPGTPLYKVCIDKGYIDLDSIDFANIKPTQSIINMPHLSADEVTFLWHYANYKVNFVENKLIKENPVKAVNAFEYVLSVVPEHCFAFYGLYQSYVELGDYDKHKLYLEKFKLLAMTDSWKGYVADLIGGNVTG